MPKDFILHHLNNSRSQRILWALEELGVDYEIKSYQRDEKTMLAPPELKAIHPLGLSPVLEHRRDGQSPIVLAESAAILRYLSAQTNQLSPATDEDARACTYWLHYAEGTLMPLLLVKLIMTQISGPKVPFLVRPVAKAIAGKVNKMFTDSRIPLHLDYIEAHLAGGAWFAGQDLSIADVQMSFPVMAAAHRAGLDGRPNITAWLKRVEARPAFERAIEKGGAIQFS